MRRQAIHGPRPLPRSLQRCRRPWPGASPAIRLPSATVGPQMPSGGLDLKEHLSNIECSLTMRALAESDGVVARAADLLRLRHPARVEKLRKYGVRTDAARQEIDEPIAVYR